MRRMQESRLISQAAKHLESFEWQLVAQVFVKPIKWHDELTSNHIWLVFQRKQVLFKSPHLNLLVFHQRHDAVKLELEFLPFGRI